MHLHVRRTRAAARPSSRHRARADKSVLSSPGLHGARLQRWCESVLAPEHVGDAMLKTRFAATQVIRQWLPSLEVALRFNVDATRHGNAARFANHRCGNPNMTLVLVRSSGRVLLRPVLVTRSRVNCGEELTFSYGSPQLYSPGGGGPDARCLCGSSACLCGLPLQKQAAEGAG